jgi:hypothetical protein
MTTFWLLVAIGALALASFVCVIADEVARHLTRHDLEETR